MAAREPVARRDEAKAEQGFGSTAEGDAWRSAPGADPSTPAITDAWLGVIRQWSDKRVKDEALYLPEDIARVYETERDNVLLMMQAQAGVPRDAIVAVAAHVFAEALIPPVAPPNYYAEAVLGDAVTPYAPPPIYDPRGVRQGAYDRGAALAGWAAARVPTPHWPKGDRSLTLREHTVGRFKRWGVANAVKLFGNDAMLALVTIPLADFARTGCDLEGSNKGAMQFLVIVLCAFGAYRMWKHSKEAYALDQSSAIVLHQARTTARLVHADTGVRYPLITEGELELVQTLPHYIWGRRLVAVLPLTYLLGLAIQVIRQNLLGHNTTFGFRTEFALPLFMSMVALVTLAVAHHVKNHYVQEIKHGVITGREPDGTAVKQPATAQRLFKQGLALGGVGMIGWFLAATQTESQPELRPLASTITWFGVVGMVMAVQSERIWGYATEVRAYDERADATRAYLGQSTEDRAGILTKGRILALMDENAPKYAAMQHIAAAGFAGLILAAAASVLEGINLVYCTSGGLMLTASLYGVMRLSGNMRLELAKHHEESMLGPQKSADARSDSSDSTPSVTNPAAVGATLAGAATTTTAVTVIVETVPEGADATPVDPALATAGAGSRLPYNGDY